MLPSCMTLSKQLIQQASINRNLSPASHRDGVFFCVLVYQVYHQLYLTSLKFLHTGFQTEVHAWSPKQNLQGQNDEVSLAIQLSLGCSVSKSKCKNNKNNIKNVTSRSLNVIFPFLNCSCVLKWLEWSTAGMRTWSTLLSGNEHLQNPQCRVTYKHSKKHSAFLGQLKSQTIFIQHHHRLQKVSKIPMGQMQNTPLTLTLGNPKIK